MDWVRVWVRIIIWVGVGDRIRMRPGRAALTGPLALAGGRSLTLRRGGGEVGTRRVAQR